MSPQFDNQLMSSFLLFLDHEILDKGAAFTNTNSYFYPTKNQYGNLFTYAAPYKPFVADQSISNMTYMTGVWLNGVFVGVGYSGLTGVNFQEGQIYFNQNITFNNNISGSYSVKDYNVTLSSKPEEELLFETKYQLRPKITKGLSGLAPNIMTYPAIFLKNNGGTNEPYAFGGTDTTETEIQAVVLADSQYNLDALLSICRDTERKYVPLLSAPEYPFNALGYYKSGVYNYDNLTDGRITSTTSSFISNVSISKFGSNTRIISELQKINPEVYSALVFFNLQSVRTPRS